MTLIMIELINEEAFVDEHGDSKLYNNIIFNI
jgi:hypothetical protein